MTWAGPQDPTNPSDTEDPATLDAPDPVGETPVDELPTELLSAAIPLPEVEVGSRITRRRAQQQNLRSRSATIFAVMVVVTLVLATVAVTQVKHKPSRRDEPAGIRPPAAVNRHAVLVALPNAEGRADTLTALVPSRSGAGGTVLLIPTGTMTELSGLGPQPIGRALAESGPAGLLSTTENLLGATIESIAVLTPDSLTTALEAAGPLRIDIPARVEEVADNGVVTVLFEKGPHTLKPSEAAKYLSATSRATDLERLARHQTFWEAWLAVARSRATALPAEPRALAQALTTLSRGDVQVRLLPVQAFGTTPADGELYRAKEADVRRTVDQVFGTTTGTRARVRILNGTGALELARKVEQRLTPADVQVTLTGNAGSLDHDTTQIIYYDPANRPIAQRIRDALGVGTLIRNRNQTDVVDVTIIVGRDFEA
jgi:hypothetical protein